MKPSKKSACIEKFRLYCDIDGILIIILLFILI